MAPFEVFRGATLLLASVVWFVRCEVDDRKSLNYLYRTLPETLGHQEIMLDKVTLTQKGYIQFLKYMADVPIITEFTFCIWIRSTNFTHDHPILSYSKHEHDRLIRGWIGPRGRTVNLEILEHEIFSVPTDFVENQWYQVCESWESHTGIWMLFIDGRLRESGRSAQMRGVSIPDQGDVVVGQEYTDFEKGLDDGIEGDIFGFNLLLAPASSVGKQVEYVHPNEIVAQRRQTQLHPPYLSIQRQPPNIHTSQRSPYQKYFDYHPPTVKIDSTPIQTNLEGKEEDVPAVLSYFTVNNNRNPKGFFDFGKSFLSMFLGGEEQKIGRVRYAHSPKNRYTYYPNKRISNHRTLNEVSPVVKPLGLRLVELSYNNCAIGRGSPIKDQRLLVSWSKTPVRVFGGALLKRVPSFCQKVI